MKGGPQTWNEFEKKAVSVTRACISLDGTRIAAVFADKTLCIYDTTGEAILSPFEVNENPRSVIFSHDGKLIASGGEALRLWDVQTGEEVESFDINVLSLAVSPVDNCIAAGCKGMYVDEGVSDGRGSYNIRVINLELAKASYFHARMLKPSGGKAQGIKLLKGEVPPSPFEGHGINVSSVAYSQDGKQIASGSADGIVRVWDVLTGKRRTVRPRSSVMVDQIRPVAFSPDGTILVSNTTLVNLSTGSCTRRAFDETHREVNSIAFSADGRFLALGDVGSAVRIWGTSTHQLIADLVGHTGGVPSVDFFPDGKQIMSASKDGTIRMWDVELLEKREMDGWQMKGNDDGSWVLGPEKECLFWTPVPFRHPRNSLVIGRCLTIDFSNFVHGDEWVKCREPL